MARPRPSLGLRLAARLSRPWRAARLADPSRGYRARTARPFLPIAGAAGPAVVATTCDSHFGSTTATLAVPVAVAAAAGHHVLLAIAATTSNTPTITSVVDTQGNAWQIDQQPGGLSTRVLGLASAHLTTALATTDTITVTLSAIPTTGANVLGIEVSGLATSAWLDAVAAIATGSSTTPTSNALTTTAAGDFLWAPVGENNVAMTPAAGWTELDETLATKQIHTEYQVAGAAGSYSAAATLASSTGWVMSLVAYKAAASSTPVAATGAPTGVGVDTGAPILGESGQAVGVGEVSAAAEGIGDTGTAVGVGEVTGTPVAPGPVAATGHAVGVGEVTGAPYPAGAGPAVRQSLGSVGATSGASVTWTPGVAVPVGDFLIVYAYLAGGGASAPSISDSAGNTWHADVAYSPVSGTWCMIFSAPVTVALTATSTITVTASGGTPTVWMAAGDDFTGVAIPPTYDATGTTATAGAQSLSVATSAATANAKDLVVAWFYAFDNVTQTFSFTAGTGYAAGTGATANAGTTAHYALSSEWASVSGAAVQTATATITHYSGSYAVIATYKAAGTPVAVPASGPVGVGEVAGAPSVGDAHIPATGAPTGVGEVSGVPYPGGPIAVPSGGPVGVGEVAGAPSVRRPAIRRRFLPPVRWEVDGQPIDVAGWSANCKANYGFDQFRGMAPERQIRRHPTSIAEGAVVTGYTDDSTEPVWQGEVTLAPQIMGGQAQLVAQGFAHRAASRNDFLAFGVQAGGAVLDQALADGLAVSSPSNSEVDFTMPASASHGGDLINAVWANLGWIPVSVQVRAVLVSGTGPTNFMISVQAQRRNGGWMLMGWDDTSLPWSANVPVATWTDWGGLVDTIRLQWDDNDATSGPYEIAVTGVALIAQTPSGTAYLAPVTLPQVLHEIAVTLGFDDSRVSETLHGLTYSGLSWGQPYDQLASYVAGHDGGRWLCLENRGSGPALEYGPYGGFDGTRSWRVRGALPSLAPQARYSGVAVSYQESGINGSQQKIADSSPAALPYVSRLAVSLPGTQFDNGALAQSVANALLPRAIAQTYSGQVKVQLASDVDGPGNPYHIRPDLVTIEDWDMGVALTQEITDVAYAPDGVTLGVNSPATAQQLLAQLLP